MEEKIIDLSTILQMRWRKSCKWPFPTSETNTNRSCPKMSHELTRDALRSVHHPLFLPRCSEKSSHKKCRQNSPITSDHLMHISKIFHYAGVLGSELRSGRRRTIHLDTRLSIRRIITASSRAVTFSLFRVLQEHRRARCII